MKATRTLHDLGQSLWLDNITRELLSDGTLRRYISDFAVTGLTSNSTIFDQAIRSGSAYDTDIRQKTWEGKSPDALFMELALDDLKQAADLFHPVHDATGSVDGWVSLEVSPLLANDAERSSEDAFRLHSDAQWPNLFIKIPGTPAGLLAIENSIFSGVPVNVTLLFSRDHYVAAAEAYMRGIERRLATGLHPNVDSVASIFVSRWDKAVMDRVPAAMPDKTLLAFADHGQVNGAMPRDGGDADRVIADFARWGIDEAALAGELQRDGAAAFEKSWDDLLACIAAKSAALQ